MVRVIFLIYILIAFVSCTSSGPALFGKQSLHEQYGKKLVNAGLQETTIGNLWFTTADNALVQPLQITVPFKQTGYFSADQPRAIGLQFSANRGAKLIFRLDKNPSNGFVLFTELWRVKQNGSPVLLTALDTTNREFSYDVDDADTYILRLQPELLKSGDYTLSISVAPSLAFPVPGKAARVGSVWGDARDGGARNHEGIDIFAPKRTPVIAIADGVINRVEETRIGGKVVWLRPKDKNLNLYYAHLDEQLVSSGQNVRLGDTLGLVGNTGNAKTTPPHLHFGIYGFGGAINPLPFVNPVTQQAPEINAGRLKIRAYAKTSKEVTVSNKIVQKHTPAFITDLSSQFATVQLPDGSIQKLQTVSLQQIDNQIVNANIKDSLSLLESPDIYAPTKKILPAKTVLQIMGSYNGYSFIKTGDEFGWIKSNSL